MVFEFLQSLGNVELSPGFTLLSLLIGGIIMAVGVILARTIRVLFTKYYAPKLSQDTAKNISKKNNFIVLLETYLMESNMEIKVVRSIKMELEIQKN